MSSEHVKGWDHVLNTLVGLPTERVDVVEAIADLTLRTLAVGRQYNSKAKVNTGVSTFVPKPFTPFQWAPQIDPSETSRRQEILFEKIGRHHGVRFGRHDAEETFLEGLVSRADRRAGDLILRAYELGTGLMPGMNTETSKHVQAIMNSISMWIFNYGSAVG